MKLNFFHRRSAGGPGTGETGRTARAARTGGEISAEIVAAIAVALYLEEDEWHDYEPAVLTINNLIYHPWSSKVFGVINQPIKK